MSSAKWRQFCLGLNVLTILLERAAVPRDKQFFSVWNTQLEI